MSMTGCIENLHPFDELTIDVPVIYILICELTYPYLRNGWDSIIRPALRGRSLSCLPFTEPPQTPSISYALGLKQSDKVGRSRRFSHCEGVHSPVPKAQTRHPSLALDVQVCGSHPSDVDNDSSMMNGLPMLFTCRYHLPHRDCT